MAQVEQASFDTHSFLRKIAWRLIPFLAVCYFVSFVDRINVGFAALDMNKDLGLSATLFGYGAGIFFIGYLLFEVPSNVMLDRIGARIWIARIMISWGVLASGMAFINDTKSFLIVRFLLGVAEAGFFPGIILYLSYWFPREFRARATAAFMMAIPLSGVLGAPISIALLGLDGMFGLRGWQLMFLIEGLPAILLGVIVFLVLPNGPESANWLSDGEKSALRVQLRREGDVERLRGIGPVMKSLIDRRVIALGVAGFFLVLGLYSFSLWLPQIIDSFDLKRQNLGWVVAVPHLVGAIGMYGWGKYCDRSGDKTINAALPILLASIGLGFSGFFSTSFALCLSGTIVAGIGLYASLPAFWAIPPNIFSRANTAVAIGAINTIGTFGGFFGPPIVGHLKDKTSSFAASLYFLSAFLLVAAIVLAVIKAVIYDRSKIVAEISGSAPR